MSSTLPLFLAGLVGLCVVGCSSDSDDTNGDDEPAKICVKVQNYTVDNQRDGDAIPCLEYPAACAGAAKGCGEAGDACYTGLNALCKEGAERTTCVAASLNGVVKSVELTCQVEKPL